jgi:hypothetical protein
MMPRRWILVLASFAAANCVAQPRVEDLEFARANYVLKSRAFSAADREKALAHIEATKRDAASLSDEQFLVAVMKIPAAARNGHDNFHLAEGWLPPTRLPFRMLWLSDDLVISRAGPGQRELLGARVERIGGATPGELMARLHEVGGGLPAFRKWDMSWFFESGEMLNALGLTKERGQLTFELRLADGRKVTRPVKFVAREEVPRGVIYPRLYCARPFEAEANAGWRAAAPEADEPLYLRDADEPFRMEPLPRLEALYVQLRAHADTGGRSIVAFAERVAGALKAAPPRRLVLDLRFDTGGNIDLTRDLARLMAATVKERIYVLTGPLTFSAGIVMAAAVKHDAGERVTLVGEPVGDPLRFWSEGSTVCLPHSRYCMHATTGVWDLTKGCAGEEGCYGDPYDARVDSLDPQIAAPLTAGAWLAGRDPAMAAIEADVGARAPR